MKLKIDFNKKDVKIVKYECQSKKALLTQNYLLVNNQSVYRSLQSMWAVNNGSINS